MPIEFIIVNNSKPIKIENQNDFKILQYISTNKYLEKERERKFNVNSYISKTIFIAKINQRRKEFYRYLDDMKEIINEEKFNKNVRKFMFKENFYFSHEVYKLYNFKSFIRLELANYLFNEQLLSNPGMENKINEYYSISNNFLNYSFINKNRIFPIKNIDNHIPLPNKIRDYNFKKLTFPEFENYTTYELFINKTINNESTLKSFFDSMKNFNESMFNDQESDKIINKQYVQNRKLFRVRTKQYFNNINQDVVKFYDYLIYLTKEYNDFKAKSKGFIDHLNKYYI